MNDLDYLEGAFETVSEPATVSTEPTGLEKIDSFRIDHTVLSPGLYVSRVDGDVTTYDLRFIRPNTPPFLTTGSMHTIEHLFATFVRSSAFADRVIYFGPMGCRTGFYFLTRHMRHEQVISLTRETLTFIANFEGEIPGATAAECGNYLDHDLAQAKSDAVRMLAVLYTWGEGDLRYPAG